MPQDGPVFSRPTEQYVRFPSSVIHRAPDGARTAEMTVRSLAGNVSCAYAAAMNGVARDGPMKLRGEPARRGISLKSANEGDGTGRLVRESVRVRRVALCWGIGFGGAV